MKKFDLKNTGILLAIMLVAGAVLVGPVSAYSENTESSESGYFWLSASGDYHPNQYTTYSGHSWTKSENNALKLYVKLEIFDNSGLRFSDHELDDGVWNLEVRGSYYHQGMSLDHPYVKATMKSKDPDDGGCSYAYNI